MFRSEATIDVNVIPSVAYRYLADFQRHKEWSTGVSELKLTSGDGRSAGAEFEATETVPIKLTSHSRIVALEEPRRIAWDAWIEGMMRAHWEFQLEPAGDHTRLVQRSAFEPQGLVARVMMNLMRKRQIPKENQKSLERIKAQLEAPAS